jgi:hypothetical protein
MDISNLSPEQLRAAADLKERIDVLQNEMNELLGGEALAPAQAAINTGEALPAPSNGRRRKKRKPVSAQGRANIAAAQRARWAAARGEAPAEAAPAMEAEEPKKMRNISAAGRRAMSLAGKRRWAKARRAARSSL